MTSEKKRRNALIIGGVWLAIAAYHVLALAFAPVMEVEVQERVHRTRPRGMHLKVRLYDGRAIEVAEHWVSSKVKVGERILIQKSPLFDAYERRHWYSAFRYLVFFAVVGLIVWVFTVVPSKRKS